MANLNLVSKALEVLQQFQRKNLYSSNYTNRKKERLYYCALIVDSLSTQHSVNSAKFVELLELSIRTLLNLCNDSDGDIRTVAEESLNKIIKSIDSAYVKKIQIQLYYEIEKNGSVRSLKAAIWRFGLLSYMISPTKGKAYISNLIPCFIKINARNEESVAETLSNSLPLILKALGSFMNDKDVQMLLEGFLPRITSSNAVLRRCTVNMILSVCLNCRKPQFFLNCVIDYVLNMFINLPADNIQVVNVIGGFGCLKILLPYIQLSNSAPENDKLINNYLLIYEYCLYFTKGYFNHNIINAALETLVQLLQIQSVEFITRLLTHDGIKSINTRPEASIFNFNSSIDPEEVALLSLQSNSSDVISKDEQILLHEVNKNSEEEEGEVEGEEKLEEEEETRTDSTDHAEILDTNEEIEKTEEINGGTNCDEESTLEFNNLNIDSETKTLENPTLDFRIKHNLNVSCSLGAESPLKYCCCQLVSSFLLTGSPNNLISDENVRVSVKSLTLITLSHIFKIDPSIFFGTLTTDTDDCQQSINDILLYANHSDPQIRGNVLVLIGFLLKGIFLQYNNSILNLDSRFFPDNFKKIQFLDFLVQTLIKGLEDVSAISCRQTLIALNICLSELLFSAQNCKAIQILKHFSKVAKNPYFLVKVKLAEVLSDLPYIVIQYITRSYEFQTDSISYLMLLLSDQDHRVRHAASTAIMKIIPKLHYRQPIEDLTYEIAMQRTRIFQSDSHYNSKNSIDAVLTLNEFKKIYNSNINDALSQVIGCLVEKFVVFESKHILLGCCETLSLLSEIYMPIIYPRAWDCLSDKVNSKQKDIKSDSSTGTIISLSNSLISQVLNLLHCSSISLDLMVHKHLLSLAGNLIVSMFVHNYNHDEEPSGRTSRSSFEFVQLWECVQNEELSQYYKELLSHIMKLLNIYVHVIDNIPIIVAEKAPVESETTKVKLSFDVKSKHKNEKAGHIKESNSSFVNISHYLKLKEILKAAHANYNITLEAEASEMYLSLLNTALEVLSQLLNLTSVYEASQIMEELLRYLHIVSNLAIEKSVLCVKHLFKTIFNTNLIAQLKHKEIIKNLDDIHIYIDNVEQENNAKKRLYMRYLYSTTQEISNILTTANNKFKDANMLRKPDNKIVADVVRNVIYSREKKNSMLASIKMFEPMVIRSLIQYTVSQNNFVPLQCEVLKLLTQLIKLHINYCSLDSEKEFINFVLKQFEFIENGYVPQTEILLPNMLDFLVNLSYIRNHSKVIISVPKILQLCDGLMASGQPPTTHIIPALIPVVEDIFSNRSYETIDAELKDLETNREVLFSMLLKLLEHHQVIELLIVCLRETELSDQQGRWKQWSEITIDRILIALNARTLKIETTGTYMSFVKLLAVIYEEAFQPIDKFLKVLFSRAMLSPESLIERKKWIGSINIIMLTLISKSNEKDILERLDEIDSEEPSDTQTSSDDKFSRFIFKTIQLVCSYILDLHRCSVFTVTVDHLSDCQQESSLYFVEQLTLFLQLCIYLFGCESYSKIAQSSENLVNEDCMVADLHNQVLKVGKIWPIIACKWIHIMTLLKCNLASFWHNVFGSNKLIFKDNEVNVHITSKMNAVIFYDYVCHNFTEENALSDWFLSNFTEEIVSLANELPVSKLSNISCHVLRTMYVLPDNPNFIKNLLLCFEHAHQLQSGAVVCSLVSKLTSIKYLSLQLKAIKIVIRRIDLLLTLNARDQLPEHEFIHIVNIIKANKRLMKHDKLIESISKLGKEFYDHKTLNLKDHSSLNQPEIETTSADKKWFISKVVQQCYKTDDLHFNSLWQTVQLLSKLDTDECTNIFNHDDFNIKIIRDSLILGARLTVEQFQNAKSLQHIPLYDVAKKCLFQKIKFINKQISKNSHILSNVVKEMSSEMNDETFIYYNQMYKLFNDHEMWRLIFEVIPSVIVYIKTLETLPDYNINYINNDHKEDLIKFATLCVDLIQWIIYKEKTEQNYVIKPHELELTLQCAECIFKEPSVNKELNSPIHYLTVCSLAVTLTEVVKRYIELKTPLTNIKCNSLEAAFQNIETTLYAHACIQTADLVVWLEDNCLFGKAPHIPAFAFKLIKSLIVSLSRQSLVNGFVLTPPQAWEAHYSVMGSGPTRCHFPIMSLESNLLNETEVLEQFVYRITLIGWTSRLQFEEMWMALLSVINVYQHSEVAQSSEELSIVSYMKVLLIRSITRLLMQMLLLPYPGDPNNSTPVYTARDPEPLSLIQNYDKLFSLQDLVLWKYESLNDFKGSYGFRVEHVFCRGNVERRNNIYEYSYGQVSVPYLWSLCGLHESKSEVAILELVRRRKETLKAQSIDLESCIQFLLELYTSWTSPSGNITLCLKNEIVKSLQSISELFLKESQFQWMLNTCLHMINSYYLEDAIFLQYIVFAVCKAAAVLTPTDKETQEKVILLLETAFKSNFLSVKIAVFHSILYLLQGSILLKCEDMTNSIVSIISEYIKKFSYSSDNSVNSYRNEEYESVAWALIFFILEHLKEIVPAAVIENAISIIENPRISTSLHQTIVQGLERLVIVNNGMDKVLFQRIIRIATDNLKQTNPILSIPATQLLLSCMYIEAALAGTLSISLVDEVELENEPEMLVRSIERSSVLFDKIKKAYYVETEILCEVVSGIFNDFFFTSNILTKVIGEFLSSQQQHPKLMSAVVFKVCERTNNSSQLDLLQEWVLFSLPNFIQNLPIAMSTWFLTCFFVSLSKNPWLKNLFPHVQCRIGKYEYEDKSILSMAALDFYGQLTNDSRKEEFVKIFNVAGKKIGSPFNDVASCFK